MARTKYIDPVFAKAVKSVNPSIMKEVGYSFDIAKRINDLLILKKWTQADLARALGKPKPLVSRWLSGTHNFTIQTIAQIETALGQPLISVKKTSIKKAVHGYKPQIDRAHYLNEASATGYGRE